MSLFNPARVKKLSTRILYLVWGVAILMVLSIQVPNWIKNYREQGQQMLSMQVTDLDGKDAWIFDKAAKRRLVVFWATWCTPCSVELARIQSAINDNEIAADQVLAISLGEELETVKAVVKQRGYTFPIYLDEIRLTDKQLTVAMTPTVLLLERDNTIYWKSSGLSTSLIYRAKSYFTE